jgi:hypothetical protein
MNIATLFPGDFSAPGRRLNFARTIAAARPIATPLNPLKAAIFSHFPASPLAGAARPR